MTPSAKPVTRNAQNSATPRAAWQYGDLTVTTPTPNKPAEKAAFDLDAELIKAGTDPRQIAVAEKVLATAKVSGFVELKGWPAFDAEATAPRGLEPIYEGDRNAIRHLLSTAARRLGYVLGSAPGQYRVDFADSGNVVEFGGNREKVMRHVRVVKVEAVKKTAKINRPSRF